MDLHSEFKEDDYLLIISAHNSRFNRLFMTDSADIYSYQIKAFSPIPSLNKHLSNDESTARTKISELQDELLFLKKQMSAKQCVFLKQKNVLLNKIELLSMENIEIKQRQIGLTQINQTLTHAIQSKQNNEASSNQQSAKQQDLLIQLQQKEKKMQDSKRQLQDFKDRYSKLEMQFIDKSNDYQRKIDQLMRQKKNIASQSQDRIRRIRESIEDMAINRGIIGKILQAFNGVAGKDVDCNFKKDTDFKQKTANQQRDSQHKEKYQENSSYLLQNSSDFSINLATTEENQDDQSFHQSQRKVIKLNRNSQPSIQPYSRQQQINQFYHLQPTNYKISKDKSIRKNEMQRKIEMTELFTEEEEEEQIQGESYLCEVCQKVYEEKEFIEHMNDCKDIAQLQIQKKKIEITLDYLSNTPQPRKSPISKQPKQYQPSKSRIELSEMYPSNSQFPKAIKHRNNSNQYEISSTARTGNYNQIGQQSSTYRGKSNNRGRYQFF